MTRGIYQHLFEENPESELKGNWNPEDFDSEKWKDFCEEAFSWSGAPISAIFLSEDGFLKFIGMLNEEFGANIEIESLEPYITRHDDGTLTLNMP